MSIFGRQRYKWGVVLRSGVVATALIVAWAAAPGDDEIGLIPVASAKVTTGIFGYYETERKDLKAFKQWTSALARHFADKSTAAGDCTARTFNRCHFESWKRFLDEIKNETPKRKLFKINKFMNTARYITDPKNWGKRDYWASPNQFFRKYGDCEDYAIAKYLSLRAMGWDANSLRIVVVQDMNLGVPHAILAVYIDNQILLLDNQIAIVVNAAKVRHYRPIYSVSENVWWRHKPKKKTGLTRKRGSRRRR